MAMLALVSSDCAAALDLVDAWLASGEGVQVVLLDAAAAGARVGHSAGARLEGLIAAGAVVAVSDEAAARRGITGSRLAEGIKPITLDELADLLGDTNATVVWL